MPVIHYNNNPNQRPSNGKLIRDAWLNCFLALSAGVTSVGVVSLFSLHNRQFLMMLPLGIGLSVGATLLMFISFHFIRGSRKRREFVSAGGDPTGMNLWMFGSMGGNLLEDGTWQWKKPKPFRNDYYSTQTTSLKDIRISK
jgi:hypothetical protein